MTTRIKTGNFRRGIVRGGAVGALGLATCLGTIGVQVLAAAPSGAVTSTITVGLVASSIAVARAGPKAGYLYVTNAGSNTVSVIDPTTNAVVATIPVGTRPTGVAVASTGPDAGDVYVTNYTSGTVSVIDPTTNTVIATIGVGTSPGGIAVAAAGPDAGDIYVADSGSAKVSVINPTSDTVTTIGVGTHPADVAVAAAGPDAGDIYVADAGSARVSVINPTSDTVTTIEVGTEPLGIAVASTATYAGDVYVTGGGSSSVSVIDPATNTVVATIGVGTVPSNVAVASTGPDAGDVYVTNLEGRSLSVIDPAATPATDVVAGDIAVGGSPTSVPADAAYETSGANAGDVYVAVEAVTGTSSVWRLGVPGAPPDVTGHVGAQQVRVSWAAATTNGGTAISSYTVETTATGTHGCTTTGATTCTVTGLANGHGYTFTVTATNVIGEGTPSTPVSASPVGAHIIAVGNDPSAIAVAGVGPDAGDVYVANTDSNTVSVFDPTNTSVDTINVGTQPSGIAVAPGGPDAGDVYVANRGSYSVSVIGPTNSVIDTIPMLTPPSGIVVSTSGDVYVDGVRALDTTGVVWAVDPTTNQVFAIIPVGKDPSGIAVAKAGPDAGDIFVANRGSNTVSVIDPATNTVVATVGVGTGPVGVAVNTLGTRVYVTEGGKDTVSAIWTTDNTMKDNTNVGIDLAGIAISSSNGDIYAVHHVTSGEVSVLNPTSGDLKTIGVGASPVAVAYEPVGASAGDIYVTATGTSSVWRLGVPGAPPDVTGHVGTQQVRVSWTAATTNGGTAISGYTVTTTATGAHGCTTGATTCTVTGLMNGHGYTFTVTATNAMGAGTPSAPVSASPVGVPAAPTTIAVAKGTHEIQISWVPPTTDGGSPVTKFTVHFTTGAVACTVGVATNQTFCDITGLVIGQKYTFYVTADNGNGTGTESTTVAATFSGVPGALTLTGATRGPGSATIQWSAPATDGATTITGYTVKTTVTGTHGCTTTGTATSCTVTGLVDGHSYTFEVYATNGIGTGPDSLGATVTPAGVPLAPTGVVVVRGTRSAFVGWGSAISQGTPITGYTVETAIVGSTLCSTTTTACTVTGLVNGQTYQITVTATNHVGQGTASTPVEVTPAGKPVAPTNVTAVGHTSSAIIEWTDSSTTNGTAITGYRAESSTGAYACTAGPTSTTCVVTGLVDGTSYVFQVRARNGVGTSATATSNSVTPSAPGAPTVPSGPQAGAPSAPTSVTGTASTRAAVISWSAPATNGAAITGYTVESSTGQHSCSTGGSPGGTTCVVTGLADGSSYTFSVTATNEAGTSAPSNPVVIMPKGVPASPTGVTAVGGAGSATISWSTATANGTAVTKYGASGNSVGSPVHGVTG